MQKQEPKGILERKAQEISKPKNVKFNDKSALEQAALVIAKLKGTKSINGTEFLNRGFLRGYHIDVVTSSGKNESMIAFVYPVITKNVMDFMVTAAKGDRISGILGSTEHVYVVKQYKI